MDRRKSLKLIATGVIAGPAVIAGCNSADKTAKTGNGEDPKFSIDRSPDELKYEKEILAKGKFFTDHEMATITLLADIIIPKDEISGSASEAGVPGFIEFIVKDMPQHQVPMRGGLRWIDVQTLKRHDKAFADCTREDQLALVDEIAFPDKAKPEMKQGVAFFNLMRNLTATGFYTSEMGVKDIGYAGNRANQWNGVPEDVLKKYEVKYTDKDVGQCVRF